MHSQKRGKGKQTTWADRQKVPYLYGGCIAHYGKCKRVRERERKG